MFDRLLGFVIDSLLSEALTHDGTRNLMSLLTGQSLIGWGVGGGVNFIDCGIKEVVKWTSFSFLSSVDTPPATSPSLSPPLLLHRGHLSVCLSLLLSRLSLFLFTGQFLLILV